MTSALTLCAVLAGAGTTVLVSSSETEAAKVTVDFEVEDALADADPGGTVENFLLVGSDSRADSDPDSPDYGGIGSADQTTGQRSDTIMVLRHDRVTNEAALLSLPRDLWVTISDTGKKNRINAAVSHGPDVLVQTISDNLGIPINHYVEVDFSGFKTLVDAIGGVPVCFDYPTRDHNTGLMVATPGCYELSGIEGLQYTRSRHFEQFKDSEWTEDPTSDLGRIKRQQEFIVTALQRANGRIGENPFVINGLLAAAQESLTIDPGLELLSLA
ncbi:MAG: LCP family protein, partial [Ilumatobacteraceae bacterium]